VNPPGTPGPLVSDIAVFLETIPRRSGLARVTFQKAHLSLGTCDYIDSSSLCDALVIRHTQPPLSFRQQPLSCERGDQYEFHQLRDAFQKPPAI
jgi:hypothetical protein